MGEVPFEGFQPLEGYFQPLKRRCERKGEWAMGRRGDPALEEVAVLS